MSIYKVVINGKDSGIRESNYKYASEYWKYRARVTKQKITLKKID
jgi:hypothetical protein